MVKTWDWVLRFLAQSARPWKALRLDISSLAVSLQADQQYHLSYSEEMDFSSAAYFTAHFADILLQHKMPDDIHLLNVNVPSDATSKTGWQITRLARQRYYEPDAA